MISQQALETFNGYLVSEDYTEETIAYPVCDVVGSELMSSIGHYSESHQELIRTQLDMEYSLEKQREAFYEFEAIQKSMTEGLQGEILVALQMCLDNIDSSSKEEDTLVHILMLEEALENALKLREDPQKEPTRHWRIARAIEQFSERAEGQNFYGIEYEVEMIRDALLKPVASECVFQEEEYEKINRYSDFAKALNEVCQRAKWVDFYDASF